MWYREIFVYVPQSGSMSSAWLTICVPVEVSGASDLRGLKYVKVS